jgi:hypothetical protein
MTLTALRSSYCENGKSWESPPAEDSSRDTEMRTPRTFPADELALPAATSPIYEWRCGVDRT